MCGILGFRLTDFKTPVVEGLFSDLCKLSYERGKEASGVAFSHGSSIGILRHKKPIISLPAEVKKRGLFSNLKQDSQEISLIAHARLITNGDSANIYNNQPVQFDDVVVVHNGIICNYEELWKKHFGRESPSELDSMVIPAFLSKMVKEHSVEEAISALFGVIEGDASIACIFKEKNLLVLATNTGALYYVEGHNGDVAFASQYSFVSEISKKYFDDQPVCKITPWGSHIVRLNSDQPKEIIDYNKTEKLPELRRCSRCILPETFPGIVFDEKGVCNICLEYKPFKPYGFEELKKLCDAHRSKDGSPDCILAFSGGRDSSYALHVLKKEMGMNPITYTYDWGAITDLARRNIARMCGKLGVENILVSADIPKKRRFVKMNLMAWLKKPEVGMLTLLMAGDKEYFWHPQKIGKDHNIDLVFFAGNRMEQTGFKSGFCGVHERNTWYTYVGKLQKLKMLFYFAKQYLRNPRYINSSIFDTLFAFYCAYVLKHNIHTFYDYIEWDEDKIISVLKKEYNWETEKSSKVTWRIGDATASFYNYIYYKMVGFTENDTFLSAQIRQGTITREAAMEKVAESNAPRRIAMEEYAKTIGFDLDKALRIIDRFPGYKFSPSTAE